MSSYTSSSARGVRSGGVEALRHPDALGQFSACTQLNARPVCPHVSAGCGHMPRNHHRCPEAGGRFPVIVDTLIIGS